MAFVATMIVAAVALAQAPPKSPKPPAAKPKPAPAKPASPTPATALPEGWTEIDQRMVFLTVQLSTIESSIDAVDKSLKQAGYQKIAREEAAAKAARGNEAMDRKGGGPVRWQEFYGKTAEKFFYHPTSGLTVHVDPLPIAQRPPQFDYIYRANEANRARAEEDAARIGDKIEDLLAYRRQLETEQSALWCRIAFRGCSSMGLSERPIYRLPLAGGAAVGDAGEEQLEAARAAVAFMNAIDGELTLAQKGLDDQKAALEKLQTATAAARGDLQEKLLALPTLAVAVTSTRGPLGQFVRSAKRMEDSSQNLVDALRLASECDEKEDLAGKRSYRGQFQQMALDFASTFATADKALTAAATAWKLTPTAAKTDPAAAPSPAAPTGADPAGIAGKLEAAKVAHAQELSAAKRQLVSAIDTRLEAAADAGDLKAVQALQSVKLQAGKDGSVPQVVKDEAILSAKRARDKSVVAANARLVAAYNETIKSYTKARKIAEASEIQEELNASGLTEGAETVGREGAGPAEGEESAADGAGAPAEPQLDGDKTVVKLPAPADDVVAGGGGRFLIFRIKKLRQLAVLDCNAAKVAKYITLPADNIVYAAGRDKLIIGVRETGAMQRYDLKTLKQESAPAAKGGAIKAMAMGYDSPGPLMVVTASGSSIINPVTMKAEYFAWDAKHGDDKRGPNAVAFSADGHTVVGYHIAGWAGVHVVMLSGNNVVSRHKGGYIHENYILPTYDGGVIFDTRDAGFVFTPDMAGQAKLEGLPGYGFPAYSPAYFVSWGLKDRKAKVVICGTADRQPIATIGDVEELTTPAPMQPHQRVHFMPKANLLVTVGEGGESVVLRKFDIFQALDEQDVDYLFVTSSPPFIATLGRTFTYQVTARSRKGKVKFSLDSGPSGMSISPEGMLRWRTPTKSADKEVSVIVKLIDEAKQEAFHSFKLSLVPVAGKAEPERKRSR